MRYIRVYICARAVSVGLISTSRLISRCRSFDDLLAREKEERATGDVPDAVCVGNRLWDGVKWKRVAGSLMCCVHATRPRTCTGLLVGVYRVYRWVTLALTAF